MFLKYVVNEDFIYNNINQVLKQEFRISTRLLHKLILFNKIFLNNTVVDTRSCISWGDVVTVNLDFEEDNDNILPVQMNLDIVFEDDAFLILNKPAGVAVHPSALHYDDSLSNGVKFYFESIGLKRKIRPVNRLDLNTSGLVVFAKNEYVQECLIKQMNDGIFKKEYIAFVLGHLKNKKGTIDLPIARKENSVIERCVPTPDSENYLNSKMAITDYTVLKEFDNFSVVKCSLKTGRTHQIRVHFSAIGHSLLSDTLYGSPSHLIARQALHSYKISFIHPISLKPIVLTCDLPIDMSKPVSRVLSFKIVIYLEHISLYVSSHSFRSAEQAFSSF